MRKILLSVAALGLSMSVITAAPAMAQSCFEDVGCPYDHSIPKSLLKQLSCDALWTVRNSIYKDNGYCFKTKKAISIWGNADCHYDDAADVPLNSYERNNIQRIKSVEQQKGC